MKTRTALMVVVATGGVLLLGLLGVVAVGRGLQRLRDHLSSETMRQQFVERWRPPAEATRAALVPARVGLHALAGAEEVPKLEAPAVNLPGLRATYTRPGSPPIEVFAARANELEAEAVFRRTRDAFQTRTGMKTAIEVNGRLRLSMGPPDETVELWSMKGWLLLFRSAGELDASFIRSYLMAIEGTAERGK